EVFNLVDDDVNVAVNAFAVDLERLIAAVVRHDLNGMAGDHLHRGFASSWDAERQEKSNGRQRDAEHDEGPRGSRSRAHNSDRSLAAAASGVRSRCGIAKSSKPTMNLRMDAERSRGGKKWMCSVKCGAGLPHGLWWMPIEYGNGASKTRS